MKKYIINFIAFTLLSHLIFGIDPNFDWKTRDFTIYFNINNQRDEREIRSPFFKTTSNVNDNVKFLWDETENLASDYQPENGWNLVHYDFGDSFRPILDLPSYPYLILYNKYTAVLRIFCFVRDFSNSNGATIALQHARGQSAIYASAYATKAALNDFDNDVVLQLPNDYLNAPNNSDDNWWLHADFPLMYDPCGKNTVQSFRFGVAASVVQNIKWTTVGTQQNEESVAESNGTQNTGDGSKTAMSSVNKSLKTGVKLYGSIDKLKKQYNESKEFGKFIQDRKVYKQISKSFEDGALKAVGKVGGTVVKAIPIVGQAFSLLDTFIGIFDSSEDGGKASATVPSKYFVNLTSTGEILTNFGLSKKDIKVPGSKESTTTDITPFYNEPVGVFNVLEAPVVEYAEYTPSTQRIIQICYGLCAGATSYENVTEFTFREYHIKDDIKFTINPASGLELVDMQVSTYFKHDYKREFNGNDYDRSAETDVNGVKMENQFAFNPERINPHLYIADNGENNGLESTIQCTPLVPINCIRNNSSFLSPYSGQQPEIWVKVVGFFKVKGSTDGKIYTHIHSFKTNPNYVNSGITSTFTIRNVYWYSVFEVFQNRRYYKFAVESIGPRKFGTFNINSGDLVLQNDDYIPRAYSSNSNIYIRNGAVFYRNQLDYFYKIFPIFNNNNTPNNDPNEPTKFYAPNIEVTGEFTSSPEMVFQDLDYTGPEFGNCGAALPTPTNADYICATPTYLAKTRPTSRIASDTASPPPLGTELLAPTFYAIPNPATEIVSLHYQLPQTATVSLSIYNTMGLKVKSILSQETLNPGNFQKQVEISDLPVGVYVVVMQTESYKHTEKLVISR